MNWGQKADGGTKQLLKEHSLAYAMLKSSSRISKEERESIWNCLSNEEQQKFMKASYQDFADAG